MRIQKPAKPYFWKMEIGISKAGTFTGHAGAVYSLAPGRENHLFFSGSGDKYIALWDLDTMNPAPFAATLPAIVYSICHLREKNILLAGTSAGGIHVIDLNKKEEIRHLQYHTAPVLCIAYSEKHQLFFSGSADGSLAVCSTETFSMLRVLKLCKEKVRSIDIHPDGDRLLVATGDGNIREYDLPAVKEIANFHAHSLSANIARYVPGSPDILSGGRDAHLNIWSAAEHRLIKSIPAHNFAIYDIAFHPEGKIFATASRDKTIKIWDIADFSLLARINKEKHSGHLYSVNRLLWTKYGNILLSAGDDRSIIAWKITTK